MARRKRQELERVHVNLFKGDMEQLQSLYPSPGGGGIIRRLVRDHLETVDRRVKAALLERDAEQ